MRPEILLGMPPPMRRAFPDRIGLASERTRLAQAAVETLGPTLFIQCALGQAEVLPIHSIPGVRADRTGFRKTVVTNTAPGVTLAFRGLHAETAETRTLISGWISM
ncbi:hypothetical protein DOU02_12250 [Clavibacter michiganensis subsp. michiganensis]|nr:hypothetical protein DOU02_12250 [Clavibacter michiganensis subsp. michiganensis]